LKTGTITGSHALPLFREQVRGEVSFGT